MAFRHQLIRSALTDLTQAAREGLGGGGWTSHGEYTGGGSGVTSRPSWR
jgi:hypothetical protein